MPTLTRKIPGLVRKRTGNYVAYEKVSSSRLTIGDRQSVQCVLYSNIFALKTFTGRNKTNQSTLHLDEVKDKTITDRRILISAALGKPEQRQVEGMLKMVDEVLFLIRTQPRQEKVDQPEDYDRQGTLHDGFSHELAAALRNTKTRLRKAIRTGDKEREEKERSVLHEQRKKVREAERELQHQGGLSSEQLIDLFPRATRISHSQPGLDLNPIPSKTLNELEQKLRQMDEPMLSKLLKASTLKQTGDREEKIQRLLAARECADTLKLFTSQQEALAAVQSGDLDPKKMYGWAQKIANRNQMSGLGSHNSGLVLGLLKDWGFSSGAFKLVYQENGMSDFYPSQAIKIAADNITELRKIDVYRVLEANVDHADEMVAYIVRHRPDLKEEVCEVMQELTGEVASVSAEQPGNSEEAGKASRAFRPR